MCLVSVNYKDLNNGKIFYMSDKTHPQYRAFRFDGVDDTKSKPYNIKIVEVETNEVIYVEPKWFDIREICFEDFE